MVIGAYLEHAAPDHPAGAEWTIQDLFAWLSQHGHDCRIVSENGHTQARVNDVLVYCRPTDEEVATHFQECDVMLTQLRATMRAQLLAATYQTPLIQYVHSATQLDDLGVMPSTSALVVYNSQHVADACEFWPGEGMVLRPPVDPARVGVVKPGACTTLINLSAMKGGMMLWRLAQDLETVPFLGVQGAYDHQALSMNGLSKGSADEADTGLPRHLAVIGMVRDIRDAFRFTRTLLVLSHSETYGRVAAEAAVSGIPTICYSTPGLRECLGNAAAYVNNVRDLEVAVMSSYQSSVWEAWREATAARWRELAARQEKEQRAFMRALRRIQREKPVMTL